MEKLLPGVKAFNLKAAMKAEFPKTAKFVAGNEVGFQALRAKAWPAVGWAAGVGKPQPGAAKPD